MTFATPESSVLATWPLREWQDVTTLVAVSGGADSVALLRALTRLKSAGEGRLVVAHLNHALRGESSDADEQFVRDLAHKLSLEFTSERVDIGGHPQTDGLEAAARDARYAFFARAAERFGARYIALAHTRDDQVETILHRIVRGTGIAGLAGIPRTRRLSESATLVRPLLSSSRTEICSYLNRLGQTWREDATNADIRHTRNRIRNVLLPLLLDQFNPRADEAMLRLGALAGEMQSIVDTRIDELIEKRVRFESPASVAVDAAHLASVPRYLRRELWIGIWRKMRWPRQAMTHAHWDELAGMTADTHANAQRIFPGQVTVRAGAGKLAASRCSGEPNLP
ncbi:MAG: tRNA lysidine(34) synthetase TilS [Planctomycetales bacterium]|nr:tRNA lysidine(34) synthetase TilS [Planctomycetales bacterium]